MGLAIISLDAVCSDDIAYLSTQKNFAAFMQAGTLVTEVDSVFITNTYPVHCSVITGVLPEKHGVVENMYPDPLTKGVWRCYRDSIKTTTLYDEARKAGIKTRAILWPVSAKANIAQNLPEVFPEKGQNQIVTSLKAGSKGFQLLSLLKYGKYLRGIRQPELDDFAVQCAVGVGKRKNFDLLLLHQTDVDSHKHIYGPESPEVRQALSRMDRRLGLLRAAYPGWDFILFGDHGCKPVEGSIDLNALWSEAGSYWHLAGGCAFLKRQPDATQTAEASPSSKVPHAPVQPALQAALQRLIAHPDSHIKRKLSDDEMRTSGLAQEFAAGVEAADGYCFATSPYKGNHGYSLRNEHYQVFYLAAGRNIDGNKRTTGGSVMDITPLAATMLGLPLWRMDGVLNREVYHD